MIDLIVVGVLLFAVYVAWVFLRFGMGPWDFRFPAPSVIFSTLGFTVVTLASRSVEMSPLEIDWITSRWNTSRLARLPVFSASSSSAREALSPRYDVRSATA